MAHILVVEDDPLVREIIEEILVLEGYVVRSTNGISKALELCRQQRPDVVITDLWLPELSGTELPERLPLYLEKVPPIILMTAVTVALLPDLTPFTAVLFKPFDLDDLLITVGSCLGIINAPMLSGLPQYLRKISKYQIRDV